MEASRSPSGKCDSPSHTTNPSQKEGREWTVVQSRQKRPSRKEGRSDSSRTTHSRTTRDRSDSSRTTHSRTTRDRSDSSRTTHSRTTNLRVEVDRAKVCLNYFNTGECKYGSGCRYKHQSGPPSKDHSRERKVDDEICYDFRETGRCRFGLRCRYEHPSCYDVSQGSRLFEDQLREGPVSTDTVCATFRRNNHAGGRSYCPDYGNGRCPFLHPTADAWAQGPNPLRDWTCAEGEQHVINVAENIDCVYDIQQQVQRRGLINDRGAPLDIDVVIFVEGIKPIYIEHDGTGHSNPRSVTNELIRDEFFERKGLPYLRFQYYHTSQDIMEAILDKIATCRTDERYAAAHKKTAA